ncbi:FAD-dependent oxidoreductase [Roseococcus thiosulfatophilus]|uniref:FAD-dependent oxidoreductase n=1 Tax=Roseococcus thiosulfatophilus TaxID=35813 RepID=UPI001A8EF89E|nr:FAD-dependent oxidoreductase [Roseococcus thiosulfatophilus]
MPFNIAIVGAGWYGCHLASSLASLGFRVTVFERNARPLHEASGNNQFRLHLGFHYARHHGTRLQSRDGFLRFIERYPSLSAEIDENIYAVPEGTSLIDFKTYKLIMVSSGIDFVEMTAPDPRLAAIEGALLTKERVLLIDRARSYFANRLGSALRFNCPVGNIVQGDRHVEVNGESFDYVIDATWGHHHRPPIDVYYEPTMLLYYEAKAPHPAVTMVDGPLASVYPTEDKDVFTLSSVVHTPLGRFSSSAEAVACRNAVNSELVDRKIRAMEDHISENLPAFRDNFRYIGVQLAIKTKPVGNFDDRSCSVFQDGRIFSIMSGKIDTIFFATERVLALIESENSLAPIEVAPKIREDIILVPGK